MDTRAIEWSDVIEHLLLSGLWGASFLFMRVAAPEFGPFPLMGLRCLIGAATLIVVLWMSGGLSRLGEQRMTGYAVGVINSAVPFVLLAFAALSITGGKLSIINALVPFWGAFIGWVWLSATLTRGQSLGLLIGFFGVVLLVLSGTSTTPSGELGPYLLAVAAGVMATLLYGLAANIAKRYLQNTNALVNATNSQIGASVFLVIPLLVYWPAYPVSTQSWVAVVGLGVFSTGLAYLLYFRLIEKIGAQRAVTVVFVVPVFAVAFGALFLNEIVTVSMVAAGVVIMLGSAMALRLLPKQR